MLASENPRGAGTSAPGAPRWCGADSTVLGRAPFPRDIFHEFQSDTLKSISVCQGTEMNPDPERTERGPAGLTSVLGGQGPRIQGPGCPNIPGWPRPVLAVGSGPIRVEGRCSIPCGPRTAGLPLLSSLWAQHPPAHLPPGRACPSPPESPT